MAINTPRLVIAGLSGDSGKTIVSLSLLAGLRRRRLSLSVFKKGPDYIDAAWLSSISGTVCRNLDTFLVDPKNVLANFVNHTSESDIAIIEGNRGLFDGKDVAGKHSTASLAKLLGAPVILVVDVTKATRTIAAVVKGCLDFEPGLEIAGIILNNVAGERHTKIISESIKTYCNLPVLGAIPKLSADKTIITGRHLGLVTPAESSLNTELEKLLLEIAEKYFDLDTLLEIAREAKAIETVATNIIEKKKPDVKIGYFKDSVFTFYYPENLEALENAGAELVGISSIDDKQLPAIDALYIGGGFPETQAEKLTGNGGMMQSVKEAAENGLPIYAECGGLIYLSNSISWKDKRYPMTGLFPVDLIMHEKPVGHGYTSLEVDRPNPFYEIGTTIKGHEFHYSGPVEEETKIENCMMVESGHGVGGGRDGLIYKNVLACYTHIHADGVSGWAETFTNKAREYKKFREDKSKGNFSARKSEAVGAS
jgi:cobyrinic acid a,c-diamide synthase